MCGIVTFFSISQLFYFIKNKLLFYFTNNFNFNGVTNDFLVERTTHIEQQIWRTNIGVPGEC